MDKKPQLILAIETSCDETAAAVLSIDFPIMMSRPRNKFGGLDSNNLPKITTLSSIVKSQIKLHSKFGGVVPEVAARAHVKYIKPTVEKAVKDSGFGLKDINYIAVTAGPGLIPSLIVGVEFAKTLALATGKPIIPVNHMAGHLYSPFGEKKSKIENRKSKQNLKSKYLNSKPIFPIISLIVSGGHTMLVLMENIKNYRVLGQTVDDAAGEAFDKVAKLLKLPYPGGPEVSRLASIGNPRAINFPRPMINSKNYNFSFSGLKTAVLYFVKDKKITINDSAPRADICASFQQAAVDVLAAKTLRAAREFGARSISLSGGVAANQALRNKLKVESARLPARQEKIKVNFFVPPINLCTDNAEMIGLAAAFMLHNGFKPKSYKTVKADSNLEL